MFCRRKPGLVEFRLITVDNIKEVELWCGGDIKGIKLPVEEQVIDIQTPDVEMRAEIGDYITKSLMSIFRVWESDIFNEIFELVVISDVQDKMKEANQVICDNHMGDCSKCDEECAYRIHDIGGGTIEKEI